MIIPRPVSLASADRMARYKVIRHAGLHARCAAPHVRETTRDYRHVEDADVPHALFDRTNDIASLPDVLAPSRLRPRQAVHGRPRLQQRVSHSPQGTAPRRRFYRTQPF